MGDFSKMKRLLAILLLLCAEFSVAKIIRLEESALPEHVRGDMYVHGAMKTLPNEYHEFAGMKTIARSIYSGILLSTILEENIYPV